MLKIKQVNKSWLLMSISVMFGLLSAWAIERHLQVKTDEIESKSNVPQVIRIVAAKDLSRTAILNAEDLATREFPKAWTTADAIPVDQAHLLIGKQLNVEMKAGQLLHFANVSEKSMAALASRLDPGQRAITIPVDQINSLSGLLSPSDIIDLFVTFEHLGKRITSPLLTGVEVLATGRDFSLADETSPARQTAYATVTLVTSPQEAVKLVAARQSGTLTAVLSQSTERDRSNQPPALRAGHLAGLLGLDIPAARSIPIIYGDRSSTDDISMIPVSWNDSSVDQAMRMP